MREVTLLDDTRLFLHDDEMLSNAIVREQDYFEREILDLLADKYPQQDVILDIGANIGNHTSYFAQYLEYSTIIAFEPVIDNYKLLRLNSSYPNLILRNEAVGAYRGRAWMRLNPDNMGACEVVQDKRDEEGLVPVNQVRIDDLLLLRPVTLMKIDVEWYEPEVLKGAKDILESDKPLVLMEGAEGVYADLLPSDYELLQAWLSHKTYLFGVKETDNA